MSFLLHFMDETVSYPSQPRFWWGEDNLRAGMLGGMVPRAFSAAQPAHSILVVPLIWIWEAV